MTRIDPPPLFEAGHRFERRGITFVVVRASHWTSRRPGYVAGRQRHYLVRDEATGVESHLSERIIAQASPAKLENPEA